MRRVDQHTQISTSTVVGTLLSVHFLIALLPGSEVLLSQCSKMEKDSHFLAINSTHVPDIDVAAADFHTE